MKAAGSRRHRAIAEAVSSATICCLPLLKIDLQQVVERRTDRLGAPLQPNSLEQPAKISRSSGVQIERLGISFTRLRELHLQPLQLDSEHARPANDAALRGAGIGDITQ